MFCRGILHERCAPAVNSGDPLGANVKQYYIDSAIRKDNSQGQADMAAPAYNDESCRFWHGSIRYLHSLRCIFISIIMSASLATAPLLAEPRESSSAKYLRQAPSSSFQCTPNPGTC